MSLRTMNAVYALERLTCAEKSVLNFITWRTDKNDSNAWPSIAAIARAVSLSVRYVQIVIKRLVKWRLISRRRRGNIACVYTVLVKTPTLPFHQDTYRGSVYIALFGDRVKIGFSSHIENRLRQLKSRLREPGTLLGEIRVVEPMPIGPSRIEHEVHDRFAHLALGHEWFRAEPELLLWAGQFAPVQKPVEKSTPTERSDRHCTDQDRHRDPSHDLPNGTLLVATKGVSGRGSTLIPPYYVDPPFVQSTGAKPPVAALMKTTKRKATPERPTHGQLCVIAKEQRCVDEFEWRERIKTRLAKLGFATPYPHYVTAAMEAVTYISPRRSVKADLRTRAHAR